MANLVTLQELTDRLEQRADIQNDQHFSAAEKIQLINAALKTLYDDLIIAGGPNRYQAIAPALVTVSGQETYQLPADFYKMIRVMVDESNTRKRALFDTMLDERMRMQAPSGGETVYLYYVPVAPALALPTDTFDCVNGFDEMVVLWATARAYVKKQLDSTIVMNLFDRERMRVLSQAPRDVGSPPRVVRASMRSWTAWPYATTTALTHYRLHGQSIDLFRAETISFP